MGFKYCFLYFFRSIVCAICSNSKKFLDFSAKRHLYSRRRRNMLQPIFLHTVFAESVQFDGKNYSYNALHTILLGWLYNFNLFFHHPSKTYMRALFQNRSETKVSKLRRKQNQSYRCLLSGANKKAPKFLIITFL